MKRSLLTLQVISIFVIGTITLTAPSVAAENVNLNVENVNVKVNGERRAEEVTNEDGVTNEDFLDEDVDTEVELQPFRYTVSPTSDLLDMDQAMLVNQVIEGLMNEYLKSLPQDQVGIFKNITLGDPENITAGGSRRSLTGARRSLFPLSHLNLRKAETASSTTIYIDRISANFTNNPPQKDIIEGWLKKAVDNGETSCTNRAANTNTLTNTAIARNSAGAIETEIDSSCYNFNLEWKNEYEKTDEQPPSEPNPNPTPTPTPTPNPDPPTVTNGGLDSKPDVSVIVKPTKKSGMALPFAFCGGGIILIIISMFIVKKRRHQRSKALAWYLSKDGQGHQGIDGPEFDGLDYIHGMNTPRNMNMGGGSKVGGFPLFPVVQHSAPPSPEEIEVAIPQKVRSSESSVSSLGASDHKPPAYLAVLATAPPVLTNLTRVNGNLYNETNEGFDQLEQDDAWVSESGMDNYRNMPRVLGSRNNSNPNSHATANSNANANANPNPSEDMSSHQLHYSDTSSISLETEHYFAETSLNANANANDASNHDHDNVISAESSEEEMFTITRPLRSPSSLNQNPRQSQSQGKSQSQPQPSLHQNPQMQLRKKVLTAEEYNDLDLGVLEYDDKSSIGLPSVV